MNTPQRLQSIPFYYLAAVEAGIHCGIKGLRSRNV